MAYSFKDFQATLSGPGGVIDLGFGSGSAEEGVTVTMNEDKNNMVLGADGSVMHSLHAADGGTITVRLLKTSNVNALLMAMYNFQRATSATWGINVFTIRDVARGDAITGIKAAFKKIPDLTYAKDGNTNEWTFDVGIMAHVLGTEATVA